MAGTFQSRTVTMRIDRPYDEVYDFVARPENFPRWASGLGRSLRTVNGEWVADAPTGPATVRFGARNAFGVLDHHVSVPPGLDVYVPMRVIANGTGSEVLFTVFRLPDATDEAFARDVAWVEQDLRALKTVLEG
jgi:hypothetical protein